MTGDLSSWIAAGHTENTSVINHRDKEGYSLSAKTLQRFPGMRADFGHEPIRHRDED